MSEFRYEVRILLVEGEKDLPSLMGLLLDLPVEVTHVFKAKEALRCLQEDTFSLMMSDVDLPDMDGFELARQARARCPVMKIALLAYGRLVDETMLH